MSSVSHSPGATSTRPIKVLVVDDDPVLLRMVQTFLLSSEDPYEVLLAGNGKEALRIARAEIPDLVLLDLMMPEMDGIEVCVQLRASRSTYLIPVIMLTAWFSSRLLASEIMARVCCAVRIASPWLTR